MANSTARFYDINGNPVSVRLVDNGDGTFSIAHAVGSVPQISTPAGALDTSIFGSGSVDADGLGNTVLGVRTLADNSTYLPVALYLWNGVSRDRQRNNHEVSVLASAARTTLQDSADLTNYNSRGVKITIDITAWSAGGPTITVQEKSTLSGKYTTILTSAVLGAVATTVLTVYPGATVVANVAASVPLSRIFKVHVAVVDATSITYSIDANFIL